VELAVIFAVAAAALLGSPARGVAEDSFDARMGHAADFVHQQLSRSTLTVATTAYPQSTNATGTWNTTAASAWTSGFFPGTLWLAHQQSADHAWDSLAEAWQAGIESQKSNTSTHDVGFMILGSFGNAYRLTGNDAYRQVVLQAAASLATRYSSLVGCIRSWDSSSEFRVIIDNMMNLELLFWASKNGGDPVWYDMAVSHALKTAVNHLRADGSTYHVVD